MNQHTNEITKEEFESRTRRILDISDKILDSIEQALEEVASTIIKTKEKNKSVNYDEELKKPLSECISETETEEIISSLIDTGSLKQIVSTLKDVKDIHLGFIDTASGSDNNTENGVIMISDIITSAEEGAVAI